jgi:hypothetical protein
MITFGFVQLIVKPFELAIFTLIVGTTVFATTATVVEAQHPVIVLQKLAVYVPGAAAQKIIGVPVGGTTCPLGPSHVPIIFAVVVVVAVNVLQEPLQDKV